MKRFPLLFCVLALFIPACIAQQPSDQPTRDELLKMFNVLRVRQQTETVMDTMLAQMKGQLQSDIKQRYPNLTPEASAIATRVISVHGLSAASLSAASTIASRISLLMRQQFSVRRKPRQLANSRDRRVAASTALRIRGSSPSSAINTWSAA